VGEFAIGKLQFECNRRARSRTFLLVGFFRGSGTGMMQPGGLVVERALSDGSPTGAAGDPPSKLGI
jgi:hypothetical protein